MAVCTFVDAVALCAYAEPVGLVHAVMSNERAHIALRHMGPTHILGMQDGVTRASTQTVKGKDGFYKVPSHEAFTRTWHAGRKKKSIFTRC
eukprot:1161176-Pelagomonas_calceolata.AAC.1